MDRDACVELDRQDPLAQWRDVFECPEGVVYLDGNSLGALPKATAQRLDHVVREEWGTGLIRSWNTAHWIDAPSRIGDKIARLIGAEPGEVVATDSTSVNLFKLLAAAAKLHAGRPERQPGRPRGRLRIQLLKRGPRPPRLPVRRPALARGPALAAHRLDGTCGPIRLRGALPPGSRGPAPGGGDAAHPGHGGAGGRRRPMAAGRPASGPPEVPGAG